MTEPFVVFVSPRARRQIAAAVAWWRSNREKAPDLLELELEEWVDRIAHSPTMGRAAHPPSERSPGLRRVLLPGARYHLYYAPGIHPQTLLLVALWHALRIPPRL